MTIVSLGSFLQLAKNFVEKIEAVPNGISYGGTGPLSISCAGGYNKGMAKRKKNKLRTDFRKRYGQRTRDGDLTRHFRDRDAAADREMGPKSERLTGRGELAKKRTIRGESVEQADATGQSLVLDVDWTQCLAGRVLRVHGLNSVVLLDDGRTLQCSIRGLLKSIGTDLRHVVVAGDRVAVRPEDDRTGVIQRVEPRHGCISRTSRGRQHLIAANIQQLMIVTSCAEPQMKPNLIDRFLVTAEKSGVQPLIVINKVDLTDPADRQPIAASFGQLGYPVLQISATRQWGVNQLRQWVTGKRTVVAGQSGVGKSSILNAIQPGLSLRVSAVSEENQKGRHTTTTAQLVALEMGGFLVDTPGIRQFQMWDLIPEEVAGYFRDFRPWIDQCHFPNCSHTHEQDCAVKGAVADGRIDLRRYDSYCQIHAGDMV